MSRARVYARARHLAMLGAFLGLMQQRGGFPHAWGWCAALLVAWVAKP